MSNKVLEVKNLTKEFNGFLAVNDISFEMEKGETLGILGPNGAGKTTTIMMLLGLINPTRGDVKIFNLDFKRNRKEILGRVNFSSAYTFLPPRLTVFENLLVFAGLYNIPNPRTKIERLLDSFGILHFKNNLVGDLSSGELTRLNLCKSLINDPELLFLDEPTASLDPDIAQKAREFLFQIKREKGISLLLTSHNMDEVTQMCNRVIFINHGKIVAAGTPLDLSKTIKKSILTIIFEAPLTKVKVFCKKNKLHCEIPQFNVLSVEVKEENISKILVGLAKAGIKIRDITIKKPDLEDVFLKFTREKFKTNKDVISKS